MSMTFFVRKQTLATCLVAVALGVLAGTSTSQAAARPFGTLALSNLDGAKVSLADLRGKVVVLNFWATWCKPCLEEMPSLAGLAQRYQSRGFVVVAASVDEADSRNLVESIAGRMPEGMEVWVGATLADMQRLEVGESLPVTVLLDREGRVARVHHGAIEKDSFDESIEPLLGASQEKKRFPGVTEAAQVRRRGRACSEPAAGFGRRQWERGHLRRAGLRRLEKGRRAMLDSGARLG